MFNKPSNLDELQEQKLLNIERNGVWFAFWGLLVAILIQSTLGIGNMMGEWIVFMCLALYLLVACLKNGIWSRSLPANAKTNLVISSITALVMGGIYFFTSFVKYEKLLGSLATGLFIFVSIWLLTFLALSFTTSLYKKKVAKLEAGLEE